MSETVTIIFETREGARIEVAARVGASVMETAVMNNVGGIEAECGGSCICATCHVYCGEPLNCALGEVSATEDDMLDLAAAERRPSSRLSCQIRVSAALDRAVFIIPQAQF